MVIFYSDYFIADYVIATHLSVFIRVLNRNCRVVSLSTSSRFFRNLV